MPAGSNPAGLRGSSWCWGGLKGKEGAGVSFSDPKSVGNPENGVLLLAGFPQKEGRARSLLPRGSSRRWQQRPADFCPKPGLRGGKFCPKSTKKL